MPMQDPFQNIFGGVRLLVDKVRELESVGQLYGMSKYLASSIITQRSRNFPMLFDVIIPGFLFYFQFLLDQDKKTGQIYVADYRIVYPANNIMEPQVEGEEGND
ncbi:hypothetical protein SBRV1_gp31 [Sulfolobales Beppu rod-shaped virus 1]|uniref:Uncharacterized protein n=1 Tax=Sulfolobales Beppu rod-shaped virus 1 TaxID=2493121 RepID=A0A3S8NFA8_9VIRU|nr:hypothetical protein QIT32_gp31 [Sulfolobales Beppu rod-shaped virus 1]AZI75920.1 hypothetical protein SBRV1_gp31 [Sulfolobales Beppu rod-shaped virus 1]